MTRVYNFATVEVSRIFRGPGNIVGIIAVPADSTEVAWKFRSGNPEDNPDFFVPLHPCEDFPFLLASIKEGIDAKRLAARKKGLSGLELFGAIVSPRHSSIRFVTRGTRYCDDVDIDAMMEELFERYLPHLKATNPT